MNSDDPLVSWRRVRRWLTSSSPILASAALLALPQAALGQVLEGPTWTAESDEVDAQFFHQIIKPSARGLDQFAFHVDGGQQGFAHGLDRKVLHDMQYAHAR